MKLMCLAEDMRNRDECTRNFIEQTMDIKIQGAGIVLSDEG